MAFIVYGPGVRDPIPTGKLTAGRIVEKTQASTAPRRIPGSDEEEAQEVPVETERQRKANVYQQAQEQKIEERAQYAYQIMSSPVHTVRFDATVEALLRLFKDKRFRHVPTIDDEHRIVGIVSDRDVLRYMAGLDDIDEQGPARKARLLQSIESLTKTRVLTASLDTQVRQIARILFEQRVGAMPIVNDSGMLHGIITRSDILKALVKDSALELWV